MTGRSRVRWVRTNKLLAIPDWIFRDSLALLAFAVGVFSLHAANESAIGPYGGIQALPVGYYGSLALILLAFLLTWGSSKPNWHEFLIEVVVLTVLLQGVPAIMESEPRFPTAWQIAGFTNFVASTGHVLPRLDARFSWPAFFAGAGLLQRASGLGSALDLVRWWPVGLNMLYLPPIGLISHRILRDAKQTMLVLWLFPLSNWVGQDYFSPQSVAFLLYLTLVAIVIGPLGRQRRRLFPWRGPEEREQLSPLPWPVAGTLLGALVVLDLALVTGHQLTPIFAAITVLFLSVLGRTRLKAFAGTMILLTAGWICYGAYPFWSGHISALFGGAGNVTGNVSGDLIARVTGSVAHSRVAAVRVAQSALTGAIALGGLARARRVHADVRTAVILMVTPFVVLPLQSYGGEAGLRIYLFALPGALCLASLLLARAWRFGRRITVGAATILLVPMFLLSAWGNESFELVRPAELSGVRALDHLAPRGAAVMSINGQISIPWRASALLKYKYLSDFASPTPRRDVQSMIKTLGHYSRGGYVVFTTGEAVYGEQTYGVPLDWDSVTERIMIGSGRFRLVFTNSATRIYEFQERRH